jgi:alkylhydroperoxidase family enzyme
LPQQVYDDVLNYFDEAQLITLLMAINTINCWNRIAISIGMVPGEYQPVSR